jgi:hypothetical protein
MRALGGELGVGEDPPGLEVGELLQLRQRVGRARRRRRWWGRSGVPSLRVLGLGVLRLGGGGLVLLGPTVGSASRDAVA